MPEQATTVVERLAALDALVTDARERVRSAEHQAATAPRLVAALRSQLAAYEADVAVGRRDPDRAWLERTEAEIASRSARLVTRRHGVAPGSEREVDEAAEAVVEACRVELQRVVEQRRRFVVDHLDDLRTEREREDEAAAERLRAALAELHDAAAEFSARAGWWTGTLGAGGLGERLHAPGVALPGLPRPSAVPTPQPTRRPPREPGRDQGAWADGVGFRRAADFAGVPEDDVQEIELPGSRRQ